MIKQHYGFTVDSEVPTTGVFQCNNLEYIHEDAEGGIDLDYANHVCACESIEKEEVCDCMVESSTYLIGFRENKLKLFEPDPEAEYCAIVRYDSNVVQVIGSKWRIRCALCSPCYPGQGDGDAPGEFLAFSVPPDVVGDDEHYQELRKRIFKVGEEETKC